MSMEEFNDRAVQSITHAINLILFVRNHIKCPKSLLIIKLGHYSIIFSRLEMKKYRVLLLIINYSIIFFLRYCIYLGTSSLLDLTIPIKETEKIPIAIHQDICPNQILKKCSAIKIDEFLKITKKTLKKKNG